MTGKYKNQIDEKLIDQLISQIDPQRSDKKRRNILSNEEEASRKSIRSRNKS